MVLSGTLHLAAAATNKEEVKYRHQVQLHFLGNAQLFSESRRLNRVSLSNAVRNIPEFIYLYYFL